MTNRQQEPASQIRDRLENLGCALLQREAADDELRWPDERTQLNYTGAKDQVLLRRTIDFLQVLHGLVPCLTSGQWRGLDYGVGWGRIASLMSVFGSHSQLDCADAWQKSLDLAKDCGLQNRMILLPPLLGPHELAADSYDFVYSYSIFTHLPATHIVNNLECLVAALKPGGQVVFTLREEKFLEFLQRSGKYNPVDDRIEQAGYWFGNAQSTDYGDTMVTEKWVRKNLGRLGKLELVGAISSEPFQVIWSIQKDS